MAMMDRVTLDAAGPAGEFSQGSSLSQVSHSMAVASVAQALDAVTDASNSYSLNSLASRQELISQRRRTVLLKALEDEEDVLADDEIIENELLAGAHLDELHGVLAELQDGKISLTQGVIDDMVELMSELRGIMPTLPVHVVDEIKDVARPLRQAVADFQNRIEVH